MFCASEFDQKALFKGSVFSPATETQQAAKPMRGDDPICASEEFMMYCFKVVPCCKQYCHDWWACPFAHEGEKARRRDPRTYKYASVACPSVKQGKPCSRGDLCPGTHNVFEYWLHPSRFRTQFCGRGIHCSQPFCFFAHSMAELRHPAGENSDSPKGVSKPASINTAQQHFSDVEYLKARPSPSRRRTSKPVSPVDVLSMQSVIPNTTNHQRVHSDAELLAFQQPARPQTHISNKSMSVDWSNKPLIQDLDWQADLNNRFLMHSLSDSSSYSYGSENLDAYNSMAETAETLLRMLDEAGAGTV